jgi:hypothetical protein
MTCWAMLKYVRAISTEVFETDPKDQESTRQTISRAAGINDYTELG